jgi:hypothetical protein
MNSLSSSSSHIELEPRQLVQELLKYYVDDNIPAGMNFIEPEDNEMTVQVLLTLYLEILKLDSEQFDAISFLEWSMNALGFRILITDILSVNSVHYASITPEGRMLLNPFHPFHIANLMLTIGATRILDSYSNLLKDQGNLPSIITLHKYADGNVDIITFECV